MTCFTNPLDPNNDNIKSALKNWTLEKLQVADTTDVQILEINCSEPNCVHSETVISVADTEGVRFFKISKPLVYIRKWDVQNWQETTTANARHHH